MPHLEQLQSELGSKVKTVKIDIFDNQESAVKYAVRGVPTVILFHHGKPAERWLGVTTKDKLKATVEQLGGKPA